jgi:hypothetical protein
MSRPDEGLIHQWLDGECTPEESARIEALVASDPEWAAAVAEARGLIAASSRIVGALDAVPRAVPAAAPSASAALRVRRRAVPSWMGVAAGLVLVAGTAYVLREKSTEPFASVAMPPAADLPAVLDTAPGVQVATDPQRIQPSREVPAVAATAPSAPPVAAQPQPLAQMPAPAPPAVADASTPAARGEVDAAKRRAVEEAAELERARAEASGARRAQLAAEAPRGAIAREASTAAGAPAAPAPLPTLPGCWRVSAPPELVGVLEAPEIRRMNGDTLVLVTPRGDVTVTRAGPRLRGGLDALLETCGREMPD